MINEIKNITAENREIFKFTILISVVFHIINCILFYKDISINQPLIIFAFLLPAIGKLLPVIVKPVYIIWMVLATIIGWIMTRIILSLLFYLILSPLAAISKLFRTSPLFYFKDGKHSSYWNKIDNKSKKIQDLEKQF